jgi:hypothetical protein
VAEICTAAHAVGALVVMDCVTSLSGCRIEMDAWGVDALYRSEGSLAVLLTDKRMQIVMAIDEAVLRGHDQTLLTHTLLHAPQRDAKVPCRAAGSLAHLSHRARARSRE